MGEVANGIRMDMERFIDRLGDQQPLRKAANTAVRLIKQRTLQGKNFRGDQFPPYSRATIERHDKPGSQPVSLRETGPMLQSMRAFPNEGSWRQSPKTVSVGPTGARNRRLARFHTTGTRYMPSRPFLGLTTNEEDRLRRTLDADVEQIGRAAVPLDRRRRIDVTFSL